MFTHITKYIFQNKFYVVFLKLHFKHCNILENTIISLPMYYDMKISRLPKSNGHVLITWQCKLTPLFPTCAVGKKHPVRVEVNGVKYLLNKLTDLFLFE